MQGYFGAYQVRVYEFGGIRGDCSCEPKTGATMNAQTPAPVVAMPTRERVAAAVVIVHVAHLSRLIEVVSADGAVLYSELLLPAFVNNRWFLPTFDVIRRRFELMDAFGILEREDGR